LVQKYGKTITGDAYYFPIPSREVDLNSLL
jgi:hypothetical protein